MIHAGVAAQQGSRRGGGRRSKREQGILSVGFIKKYIQFAKGRKPPVLTKAAADKIVDTYTALRNDDLAVNQRKTSPMTARTLETLIRLSTAHAKARLANTVDEEDAQVAADILKFALFREVVEDEKVKRRRLRAEARAAAGAESSEEESSDDDAKVALEVAVEVTLLLLHVALLRSQRHVSRVAELALSPKISWTKTRKTKISMANQRHLVQELEPLNNLIPSNPLLPPFLVFDLSPNLLKISLLFQ